MTLKPTTTIAGCLMLMTSVAGCSTMSGMNADAADPLGTADLMLADGTSAGTAQLVRDGDGFAIQVSAMGLQPGAKGFHLHTTGRCDAPDFTSAGGHLNPGDRDHGRLNPQGPHLGDMTNLQIGADGTASATVAIPDVREDTLAQIFDADGTAVMIHSGPDDYRTNPSGDAGSRVACGVLVRS